MKNTLKLIILSVSILLVASCEKEVETEYASTYPVSGTWSVIEYLMDGTPVYGPSFIDIYNTSFSEDSVWIANIYDSEIMAKAKVDGSTFSATGSLDYSGQLYAIDITNGKIINTDSIYFEVTLYSGEGEVYDQYIEAGVRKTGFE